MAHDANSWLALGHRFGVVDSTMASAQQLAIQGAPHGTWVLAERQTAGRGRRGRTWQSAPRGGVYMTLLLRPAASAHLGGLPLVFGMAVRDAILETLVAHGADDENAAIGLKWPNDIVARGRKLAGILLETDDFGTAHPSVRVGMGINVASAESLTLPADIATRYIGVTELAPAALSAGTDLRLDAAHDALVRMWVDDLAIALVRACFRAYGAWQQHGLGPTVRMWPKYDVLYARRVEAQRGAEHFMGIARGVGPDGRLRLQTACGFVWIDSGEIRAHSQSVRTAGGLTKDAPAVYVGLTPEAL